MNPRPEKKARIRRACDSCNIKRTKCNGDDPCGHCAHNGINCTYLRQEKRRGRASEKYPKQIQKRKSKNESSELKTNGSSKKTLKNDEILLASKKPDHGISHGLYSEYFSTSASTIPSNSLLVRVPADFNLGITRFPILMTAGKDLLELGIPYEVADELFEFYFDPDFPPATKTFSFLRRIPMLKSERPTQSNLLLCILLSSAAQINHRFFVGSNRDYACQALYRRIQSLLPRSAEEFTLDDFLCVTHLGYYMPWLSYPSDSVYWLKLGHDVARRLKLNKINENDSSDAIEEKTRGWWAFYTLDRMTAFCFNIPILCTEDESNEFFLPSNDTVFNKTDEYIPNPYKNNDGLRLKDFDYDSKNGISGWMLNIGFMLGKFIKFRDTTDPNEKKRLKYLLSSSFNNNLENLSGYRTNVNNPSQRIQSLEVLYARFINLVLAFMVGDEDRSDIFEALDAGGADIKFESLEKCIISLEEIAKVDEGFYKHPFVTSFFVFIVSISLISTLNDIDSTDKVSISKINKYKYNAKVVVRVIGSLLDLFPGEFLKTLRNLLSLSVGDCENLILLTDYIEVFKQNVKKTREALKAYSWGKNGRGIAV